MAYCRKPHSGRHPPLSRFMRAATGSPSQICFARGDAPPYACRWQVFVVASCGSSTLSLSSPPVPSSSAYAASSGFASLRSASLVAVAPRDMPSPVGSGFRLASLALFSQTLKILQLCNLFKFRLKSSSYYLIKQRKRCKTNEHHRQI